MAKKERGDVRKRFEWEEPRAIPEKIIRKRFDYPAGKIDLAFCESKLWWWRPLSACLKKEKIKKGDYLVHKKDAAFFPSSVFSMLQQHHDAGEMHSLLHLWRSEEIGARLGHLDEIGPYFLRLPTNNASATNPTSRTIAQSVLMAEGEPAPKQPQSTESPRIKAWPKASAKTMLNAAAR